MKRYRIRKDFIIQKKGGTITIFDGEQSTLYSFNTTAACIFEHLKKGHGDKEIVAALQKKYQMENAKNIVRDVSDVIALLKKKHILEEY